MGHNKNLKQKTDDRGRGQGLLEFLFESWIDRDPVYNDEIRDKYKELGTITGRLELGQIDRIDNLIADLCIAYAHGGFRAGIRTGVQLVEELLGAGNENP